jgi:hypothetical protein
VEQLRRDSGVGSSPFPDRVVARDGYAMQARRYDDSTNGDAVQKLGWEVLREPNGEALREA